MKSNTRLLKKCLCGLCIMTMVISLMACGNNEQGNGDSTQKGTETGSQVDTETESESETEFSGTEDVTEEGTETGIETDTDTEHETDTENESETTDSTDTESDTAKDEYSNSENTGNENTNGGNTDSGNTDGDSTDTGNDNTGSGDNATDSEDEIYGAGSATEPYMETPMANDEGMYMTTVSIGAGKSVFYSIYRVGGMILTIHDANAYVVHDGTRYDAQNGVVSFEVKSALASAPVDFEIGNKGSSAVAFTIEFANPAGSYMNPTKITSLSGSFSLHLEKGNSVGHYYKYIAEKTGIVTFYISEVTSSTKNAKAFISVTNNNTYANRTTDADGESDGSVVVISLEVTAGDEIMIQVGVSPTATWKYPEEDITWVAQYQS